MATFNITLSTPIARIAADWYRRAMTNKLSGSDYARWLSLYPNAIEAAIPEEFEMLLNADCAVEASLH